ncbi:MAG: protein phosphatase 2C domain-containing protein [Acidobacteriota bacterium]|nr:protein phosphatase 2C domain-containing protein [Acidobacteriota bacterium]
MRPDSTNRESLHWASASDRGRVRPGNEDFAGDPKSLAALAGPEASLAARGALFAVADGMGGHSRGEVASKLAVEVLFTTFYTAPGEPAERFRLAMIAANTAVRRAGILAAPEMTSGRSDAEPLRPMGTTLVAAVVLTPWVLFGNVGDSRAYLLQNGTLEQVSRDHSYLAEEIRRGLVSEEAAAAAFPFRHLITRSMGSRDDIEVDLFWRPWPAGSTLLLATDGLHGVVDDARVAAILASQPPDVAVRHLVDSANEAGGPDNVTVLVVQSPQPEPRTRSTA